MKRFPWIHLGKKTDPEVPFDTPIPLGDFSNSEFFHEQTPRERKLKKLILETCAEKARYLGMDRREFIASTMGMATTLSVFNLAEGCSSDGGYRIDPNATLDSGHADAAFGDEYFILDMQTHHVEDEEHWRQNHPGQTYVGNTIAQFLTFYSCPELGTTPIKCVDSAKYVENIFLGSDTTVAVLSGFPGAICADATMCAHPISNEDMVASRDRVNAAAGSQRMLQHCQVDPNDQWLLQAQAMEKINKAAGNSGWKVYPAWPGPATGTGWWMDDPAVAYPFYEKAIALGQPIVCAHKGLKLSNFLPEFLDPKDVGPAAAAYPNINFVIYHSAVEIGIGEGEYKPSTPTSELHGMDRLIRTVEEHNLKDKNVYAEMGSAWYLHMNDPIASQHYIGKALKYLGEDRLVWGSECVWFNSPQPQIEAFKSFEISEEFQTTYGYPALTKEIKAKIFGLSAAKLYNVDTKATRHAVDTSKIAMLRRELDGELGGRRWMFQPLGGPRTRREFMDMWRWRKHTGLLG